MTGHNPLHSKDQQLSMSQKSILTMGPKKKSHKRVRFPGTNQAMVNVVAEVQSCFDFNEEEKEVQWYSRNDYQFSRSTARVIAKESERYGHSKQLDDVYVVANSYRDIQTQLNLWVSHGASRRGLERWANRQHGQSRKDDQTIYIDGVLRAQSDMRLKDAYEGERLREVGSVLSRKARRFAQMLGQADEYSVMFESRSLGNGDAPMASTTSKQQPLKVGGASRNLGLGGPSLGGKINRLSDLPNSRVRPASRRPTRRIVPSPSLGGRRTGASTTGIRQSQSGRVPRMA